MALWETIFGASAALAGGFMQQLWAYWNRSQDIEREDRKRLSERHEADIERIRLLYKRVARVGNDYRQHGHMEWKDFLQRHSEIRADLDIDGSDAVRRAFHEYLDGVQGDHLEAEDMQYDEDRFWNHYDKRMEKLTNLMREEITELGRAGSIAGMTLLSNARRKVDEQYQREIENMSPDQRERIGATQEARQLTASDSDRRALPAPSGKRDG